MICIIYIYIYIMSTVNVNLSVNDKNKSSTKKKHNTKASKPTWIIKRTPLVAIWFVFLILSLILMCFYIVLHFEKKGKMNLNNLIHSNGMPDESSSLYEDVDQTDWGNNPDYLQFYSDVNYLLWQYRPDLANKYADPNTKQILTPDNTDCDYDNTYDPLTDVDDASGQVIFTAKADNPFFTGVSKYKYKVLNTDIDTLNFNDKTDIKNFSNEHFLEFQTLSLDEKKEDLASYFSSSDGNKNVFDDVGWGDFWNECSVDIPDPTFSTGYFFNIVANTSSLKYRGAINNISFGENISDKTYLPYVITNIFETRTRSVYPNGTFTATNQYASFYSEILNNIHNNNPAFTINNDMTVQCIKDNAQNLYNINISANASCALYRGQQSVQIPIDDSPINNKAMKFSSSHAVYPYEELSDVFTNAGVSVDIGSFNFDISSQYSLCILNRIKNKFNDVNKEIFVNEIYVATPVKSTTNPNDWTVKIKGLTGSLIYKPDELVLNFHMYDNAGKLAADIPPGINLSNKVGVYPGKPDNVKILQDTYEYCKNSTPQTLPRINQLEVQSITYTDANNGYAILKPISVSNVYKPSETARVDFRYIITPINIATTIPANLGTLYRGPITPESLWDVICNLEPACLNIDLSALDFVFNNVDTETPSCTISVVPGQTLYYGSITVSWTWFAKTQLSIIFPNTAITTLLPEEETSYNDIITHLRLLNTTTVTNDQIAKLFPVFVGSPGHEYPTKDDNYPTIWTKTDLGNDKYKININTIDTTHTPPIPHTDLFEGNIDITFTIDTREDISELIKDRVTSVISVTPGSIPTLDQIKTAIDTENNCTLNWAQLTWTYVNSNFDASLGQGVFYFNAQTNSTLYRPSTFDIPITVRFTPSP